MERQFLDPITGEIHGERFFLRENIDLRMVIEVIENNGAQGFIIIPDHVQHMTIRSQAVFDLLQMYTLSILDDISKAKDEETAESLNQCAMLIAKAAIRNLVEMKTPTTGTKH